MGVRKAHTTIWRYGQIRLWTSVWEVHPRLNWKYTPFVITTNDHVRSATLHGVLHLPLLRGELLRFLHLLRVAQRLLFSQERTPPDKVA